MGSGFLGHVTQVEILVGGDVDEAQGEGVVSDPHPSAVAQGPLLSLRGLLNPELSAVPAPPESFLGHPVWNNQDTESSLYADLAGLFLV